MTVRCKIPYTRSARLARALAAAVLHLFTGERPLSSFLLRQISEWASVDLQVLQLAETSRRKRRTKPLRHLLANISRRAHIPTISAFSGLSGW
jgi:hypothetical protein